MRINLKNFRQSHGLFQSEMAEILGINQSNVSRAEIRGGFDLTYNQIQTLYERFGQEDVDSFAIPESRLIDASNNTNVDGTQNNGVFGTDPTSLEIIKQQSEALAELTSVSRCARNGLSHTRSAGSRTFPVSQILRSA